MITIKNKKRTVNLMKMNKKRKRGVMTRIKKMEMVLKLSRMVMKML